MIRVFRFLLNYITTELSVAKFVGGRKETVQTDAAKKNEIREVWKRLKSGADWNAP